MSSIVEALGHVHVGLTRDVAVLVEALVQLLRYDELTEHDTLGEEVILGERAHILLLSRELLECD